MRLFALNGRAQFYGDAFSRSNKFDTIIGFFFD